MPCFCTVQRRCSLPTPSTDKMMMRLCVPSDNFSLLREHSFSNSFTRSVWTVLGRSRSVSLTSIIFLRRGIQPLSSSLDVTLCDAGICMQTAGMAHRKCLENSKLFFWVKLEWCARQCDMIEILEWVNWYIEGQDWRFKRGVEQCYKAMR